ncbi:uncharacterized protein LOC110984548 [Acanthaster planci]|uniref:Uncharacterized protein LOC110984548 n=1 Tax=Acanthaster planci TaxID=133434 RepID=A0A8B7ZBC2_ACAPL|nr:uncharacterized protein LOC110984548 [Acanthaster planci]
MDSSLLNQHLTVDSSHSYVLPRLCKAQKASNMALNEQIRQMIAEGKSIYHFGFGQSPFPVVEGARRVLAERAGENAYLPVAGLLELRVQICNFHAQLDGLGHLDPNMVIVGPGTKQVIYLLIQVFRWCIYIYLCVPFEVSLTARDSVLILSPSWITYKPMTVLAGKESLEVVSGMEDGWKLTPRILEKTILESGASKNHLLIFCNPDNPTGISYSEAELMALSGVLRKYNVVVLSDEIYGHTQYQGDFLSLAKYYPEGTIISSGLSKCFSAGGWRCGYSIYPKELVALYKTVCSASSHTHSCAAAPVQHAAIHNVIQLSGLRNSWRCASRCPECFLKEISQKPAVFQNCGVVVSLLVLVSRVNGLSEKYISCLIFVAPLYFQLFKLGDETKEYLKGCRCIMGALAKFCHRELTRCGVQAILPVAGYYIFPDFEILRPVLEARGILTCEQMCEALFKEADVVVMAGGPGFMRPLTEFTVRLCFVNFDGGVALDGWRRQGCKETLDQEFLDEFCSPVVLGIKAIVSWVEKQQAAL